MPLLEPPDLSKIMDLQTEDLEAKREIANYCRIDLQVLESAMERHPALVGFAVACYELADVAESQRKWDVETAKAQAFIIVTEQDPKLSATAADKKVLMYPLVRNAMEELIKARTITARLKGLVSGLEHRRDMLVQIAAKQRKEGY